MDNMMPCAETAAALSLGKDFCLPVTGGVVSLRPALTGDREFLFQVYAGTRSEEMKLVDWDDSKKDEFLRMQFSAQDKYYREFYPSASFFVLLFEDRPCGRFYVDQWDTEIRIMDVALLPDFRNRGIGTALLKQIREVGSRLRLPVTIHVEQFNPALRLYQRLGFMPAGENGIYLLMRWSAGEPANAVNPEDMNHA